VIWLQVSDAAAARESHTIGPATDAGS
jgi:hypothetical protein